MMKSTEPAQILIVDDEVEIGTLLRKYLTSQGYQVSVAYDSGTARNLFATTAFDLVILDLMLPDEDGFSLARYLRERYNPGIIMLTGRSDTIDRVVGLEVGADDYVAKPFDLRELLARIKSVLRRVSDRAPAASAAPATPAAVIPAVTPAATPTATPTTVTTVVTAPATPVFRFAGWRLETATRQLWSPEEERIALTAGEFDLLLAFLDAPNRILSRDHLMDRLHNRDAGPFDRSIDVQVSRLRRKLDRPEQDVLLQTIRSAGYVLTATVEKSV